MLDVQNIAFLRTVFIAVFVVLGTGCVAAILYGAFSKRFTDKLVAVNIITTLAISTICMLAIYLKEYYILDIALIFALLSFVAVVVLSKLLSENKRGGDEK